MNQLPTIKLPTERIEQLKAIGAALNLPSLADVAGYLIRSEIAKGTIPDGLPGVAISKSDDGILIALDGAAGQTYSRAVALQLAEAIENAANGVSLIDVDADFIVARVGNGIKISVPLTGEPRAFSRDVARDLSRLIAKAAE